MFNKFIKWIMFITSYTPVILLLISQNWNKLIVSSNFKYILAISTFIIIGSFIYLSYTFNIKTKKIMSKAFYINKIENKTNEVINYLIVYLFPFMSIDISKPNHIVSFVILFFLIGIIYVNTNMIYINPILTYILKYNIYNVTSSDGSSKILLSKKSKSELIIINEIQAINISNDLWIEKNT